MTTTIIPSLPSSVTLGQPSANLVVPPLPGPGVAAEAFGVVGDGVTDNTVAMRVALAACGNTQGLHFGPGSFCMANVTVPNSGISITGAGRFLTSLVNNSPTGDTLNFTGSFVTVSGLGFTANVTKTAGWFVKFGQGGQFTLRDFYMQGHYRGIDIQGGITDIQDGVLANGVPGTPGQFQSGGISIGATASFPPDAIRISNVIMSNGSGAAMTSYGIQCSSTGDLTISDCRFTGQGIALNITPNTGQAVASVWAMNSVFDGGQTGIFVQAFGTGTVSRCRFHSCRTTGHVGNGVTLDGTTAGIYSVAFVSHQACSNGQSGLAVVGAGPNDTSIKGGLFAGNAAHGIFFDAGVQSFDVMGVSSGAYGGLGGNTLDGIIVSAGASDHYVITDNRVHGNGLGGVADGGTGSNRSVTGNPS